MNVDKSGDNLLNYVIKHTDERFDSVDKRIDKLEEKIDQLLQFKWQMIGGTLVFTIIFQVILALIQR